MRATPYLLCLAITLALAPGRSQAAAEPPPPAETPAEREARMAWFAEARFGMFIHWGLYSVPAGEWKGNTGYGEWFLEETKIPVSQYAEFVKQFNPVKFDAKEWVRIAQDAGMKYLVITSKHHDGFAIYPSKLTDWCISSTPFPRDPLAELNAACKKADIRFCTYHSIMDWHHPDYANRRAYNDLAKGTPDMDRYTTFLKGQLKEIIENYRPGIMWFDGEWEGAWTHERAVDLHAYLRRLDPELIINNRIDKFRHGMAGMNTSAQAVGDYGTPEQEIPATGFGPGQYWESCMTLNNHWGYNKHDLNWKSPATVIRNLVDIVSKGGNYLLNVGPDAEGCIPEGSVKCLAEVGRWMKVNGSSIYGTSASPFKKLAWGRCTQKPAAGKNKTGLLYLHVFDWPKDGVLTVPGLANQVKKAYLLADRKATLKVTDTETGDKLIAVGATAPDPVVTVVVLEIVGAPEIGAAVVQAADGSVMLLPGQAQIHGSARVQQTGGKDNIGYWSDPACFVTWQVKIAKPGAFEVELDSACEGEGGSTYTVSVGAESLQDTVAGTGGWDVYKTRSLGKLSIPTAGTVELTVRPVSLKGAGLMNLQSLRLKPAK